MQRPHPSVILEIIAAFAAVVILMYILFGSPT